MESGRHLTDVGPLPIEATQGEFSAEYLKSTFAPGMTAWRGQKRPTDARERAFGGDTTAPGVVVT